MAFLSAKNAQSFLDKAEIDVRINGSRPWDIKVKDERLFTRAALWGTLGLGEAYMDGWWECDDFEELFYRVITARSSVGMQSPVSNLANLQDQFKRFRVAGKKHVAKEVGEQHYDIGNEFYEKMLGKTMAYTCAFWGPEEKRAKNLDEAQENKYRKICEKLKLKPGMKVLDIGCGFGSFAAFAAEHYGVLVTGVTISKEQKAYAEAHYGHLPITIKLEDYRDIKGEKLFDRILSIGMFEHVGRRSHKEFFEVSHRLLKDDGISLVHTIGGSGPDTPPDPWVQKYIFPNSEIPAQRDIPNGIFGLFRIEDWENFGFEYSLTLQAWWKNSSSAREWLEEEFPGRYEDRFWKMWELYLRGYAAVFRARQLDLWQVVITKTVNTEPYYSVR